MCAKNLIQENACLVIKISPENDAKMNISPLNSDRLSMSLVDQTIDRERNKGEVIGGRGIGMWVMCGE